MIKAEINRDSSGNIKGFTVENHGRDVVCAGVSMLVLNTVNSIEALTEDEYTCDFNDDGGFLSFRLKNPETRTPGTGILLDAMSLGLSSTKAQYPDEIEIMEVFSND
ncbi:MAG: ribosomal-processing cysteine protease Prp [Defluviitaleaceae bacterium]|nr:ribosomal-processing cysteine protease Prp [Defluviitaleaceae bacterium]